MIDVSAYFPRAVEQLADVLDGRAGHCVHISSISAYDDAAITPDEDSPLYGDLADPTEETVTGETYGPLKAMCERAAVQRFGAPHTTVIRPTYVIGPWDKTDRFTYWVRRMERGGDVAVVSPDAPLQVIDGRDLGTFMVRCAVDTTPGAFDGVGPHAPLSDLLAQLVPEGVGHRLVDVGGAALEAAGVVLPLLSPEEVPEAFLARPGVDARAAGLTTRPLADTVADLRAWDADRGTPPLVAGPTARRRARPPRLTRPPPNFWRDPDTGVRFAPYVARVGDRSDRRRASYTRTISRPTRHVVVRRLVVAHQPAELATGTVAGHVRRVRDAAVPEGVAGLDGEEEVGPGDVEMDHVARAEDERVLAFGLGQPARADHVEHVALEVALGGSLAGQRRRDPAVEAGDAGSPRTASLIQVGRARLRCDQLQEPARPPPPAGTGDR